MDDKLIKNAFENNQMKVKAMITEPSAAALVLKEKNVS